MSTKSPEFWASDPDAPAVKIEASAEQSLLLPFGRFASAELKSAMKKQRLRLVSTTHEIMLRGHSLRRIEPAMQRMELAVITTLPAHQRSLIVDGQPSIHHISVIEVQDKENEGKSLFAQVATQEGV